MENNDLQKIWKDADRGIQQKSKDELIFLLTHITKRTINKFIFTIAAGTLSGIGLIVFLSYTSLNRQNDPIYLINNITLGIISLISVLSGLISWYKLQNRAADQSLKSWLEVRINYLSRLVNGRFNKLYVFILPIIYALTVLSIHVYYENKPFLEVIGTEESMIGLIVGTPVGLVVSFIAAIKIRKKELADLEFLKDIYGRLNNAN